LSEDSSQFYDEASISQANNYNHRLNMRMKLLNESKFKTDYY